MPSIEAYNTIEIYPSLYGQGLVMQLLTGALTLQHPQQTVLLNNSEGKAGS
jgi:unsaturated rhamnogalacturonyl hydrolase